MPQIKNAVVASNGAPETLALDNFCGFVSDSTRGRAARQQKHEVCQRCGVLRPVAYQMLVFYMEDQHRGVFVPLCGECTEIERARIERNRARRRWRG